MRESDQLMAEVRQVVNNTLDKCVKHNAVDWGKIKTEVKNELSDYLWIKMKRSPMILPIIMEI